MFLKALASAQNLHCKTTISAERLPVTVSAFKHDHDIFIIKSADSRKINRNKNLLIFYYGKSFPSFPMHRKKVFHAFSFPLCFTSDSKFSFNFTL